MASGLVNDSVVGWVSGLVIGFVFGAVIFLVDCWVVGWVGGLSDGSVECSVGGSVDNFLLAGGVWVVWSLAVVTSSGSVGGAGVLVRSSSEPVVSRLDSVGGIDNRSSSGVVNNSSGGGNVV